MQRARKRAVRVSRRTCTACRTPGEGQSLSKCEHWETCRSFVLTFASWDLCYFVAAGMVAKLLDDASSAPEFQVCANIELEYTCKKGYENTQKG